MYQSASLFFIMLWMPDPPKGIDWRFSLLGKSIKSIQKVWMGSNAKMCRLQRASSYVRLVRYISFVINTIYYLQRNDYSLSVNYSHDFGFSTQRNFELETALLLKVAIWDLQKCTHFAISKPVPVTTDLLQCKVTNNLLVQFYNWII